VTKTNINPAADKTEITEIATDIVIVPAGVADMKSSVQIVKCPVQALTIAARDTDIVTAVIMTEKKIVDTAAAAAILKAADITMNRAGRTREGHAIMMTADTDVLKAEDLRKRKTIGNCFPFF
jgi:hypothetical protein